MGKQKTIHGRPLPSLRPKRVKQRGHRRSPNKAESGTEVNKMHGYRYGTIQREETPKGSVLRMESLEFVL